MAPGAACVKRAQSRAAAAAVVVGASIAAALPILGLACALGCACDGRMLRQLVPVVQARELAAAKDVVEVTAKPQ